MSVRILVIVSLLWPVASVANGVSIPLIDRGASTYYVEVAVDGAGTRQFLVDTGSSYSSVDEATLRRLRDRGLAAFERRVGGTMADGSRRYVPLYTIEGMSIGGRCRLRDVTVAVLPGRDRPILGLNALRRAAPVTLSMEPPRIRLGNCVGGDA